MKPEKHIEQKLEALADKIGTRNSFVDNVMTRIKNSPVQGGNVAEASSFGNKTEKPNIVFRRILMKNPLKFTAAAVILIAIGLFMHFQNIPFDGATKVYGMTDVPDLFRSAKTLHIIGKIYFPEYQIDEPVEIEHWVDIENTRWHSITPSQSFSSKDGFDCYLNEEIFDGLNTKASINHREKKVTYFTVSEFHKNLSIQQTIVTLLQLTCGQPELFDTYQILGQEVIDGQVYNLWEGIVDYGPMKAKLNSWLSPQTGQMAKAVIWMSEDGTQWHKKCQFDTVEMNVPINESIFKLAGPADYQATNTIETAIQMAQGKMVGGLCIVDLEEYFLFALPDKCLIMCWRNEFQESPDTESQYFTDLYFGGPVPKLPAEVYALKTEIDGQENLWQGRHLTYTQKNGKFYEWALYIPEQSPPTKPGHMYSYSLVYRMNIDQKASVTLAAGPDMTIEDQADFEKLIIEAIRTVSDDQELPAPFTLEQVLSLASEQ